MPVQHAVFRKPLRSRRHDVVFLYFIEKAVLSQERKGCERRNRRGQHRKRYVPEIIGELSQQAEVGEVVGYQAAQRKDLEV